MVQTPRDAAPMQDSTGDLIVAAIAALGVILGGLATAANQVLQLAQETITAVATAAINTKTPALGQALAGASVPSVLPAAQEAALTPPTAAAIAAALANPLPVSLPAAQVTAMSTLNPQPVTGTFWQATQPISAAALPLPANAAQEAGGNLASILAKLDVALSTRALEAGGNLASILTKLAGGLPVALAAGGGLKVEGVAGGVAQPVSGTFWQATQPISAASLPLPAGAATSAKQKVFMPSGAPVNSGKLSKATANALLAAGEFGVILWAIETEALAGTNFYLTNDANAPAFASNNIIGGKFTATAANEILLNAALLGPNVISGPLYEYHNSANAQKWEVSVQKYAQVAT